MTYHWDKFFHIAAVIIVNNRDHALHYAIEGEIKSGRTFLTLQSVVDERGCYYLNWLIVI